MIRLKINGMINKMVKVELTKPPITACPNGATCSPPSPIPNAIGVIPASMANAVIKIGRNLDLAANKADLEADRFSFFLYHSA